jgi:hypothetical protein
MENEPKLTDKQKAFADHFLLSQDATAAAIHAGYTGTAVRVTGSKLKHSPTIKLYLENRAKQLVSQNIDQIAVLCKGLSKKDQYQLEVYKAYEAIKDPTNNTKFKYLELLGKVLGHLSERDGQNLGFNRDGKVLTVSDIMKEAGKVSMTLERIRIEAEKYADPSIPESISPTIMDAEVISEDSTSSSVNNE